MAATEKRYLPKPILDAICDDNAMMRNRLYVRPDYFNLYMSLRDDGERARVTIYDENENALLKDVLFISYLRDRVLSLWKDIKNSYILPECVINTLLDRTKIVSCGEDVAVYFVSFTHLRAARKTTWNFVWHEGQARASMIPHIFRKYIRMLSAVHAEDNLSSSEEFIEELTLARQDRDFNAAYELLVMGTLNLDDVDEVQDESMCVIS